MAKELKTASKGIPKEIVLHKLKNKLETNLAMTPEAAQWAVETWALALSVITEEELTTVSEVKPPPVEAPLPPKPLEVVDTKPASTIPPSPPTLKQPFTKTFSFQASFEVVKVNSQRITIKETKQATYLTEHLGNGVVMDFVYIPGGTFLMGVYSTEDGSEDDEKPQHQVIVEAFWMSKYPVTQAQYQTIMKRNPSHFRGAKRPVEQASWHDAVEFCRRLSQKLGKEYRLPSEAQWEYACRAATTTPFYFGETITTDLANYDGNYPYGGGTKGIDRASTTEVGIFPPNAFGLYDMHGNVWEWCEDTWHPNYRGAPSNDKPWINNSANHRLLRGGAWNDGAGLCRSAYRDYAAPDILDVGTGFRLICTERPASPPPVPSSVQVPPTNTIKRSVFLKRVLIVGATALGTGVIGYLLSNYRRTVKFEVVTVNSQGEIITRENKEAAYVTKTLGNNVTMDFVFIAGGTFLMGASDTEAKSSDDEKPRHEVTVKSFWMSKYLVTQAQYKAIMGENPSYFSGNNRPVERVSWEQAVEFCGKLSDKLDKKYRLPSEAQWEYACRAGTTTPFHFGETLTTDLANYDGDSTYADGQKGVDRAKTTEVGIFPPNAFGLYDMHGNVYEWCADKWHTNYDNAPTDGSVWIDNNKDNYVRRGGSWEMDIQYLRSANRNNGNEKSNGTGFRLVFDDL